MRKVIVKAKKVLSEADVVENIEKGLEEDYNIPRFTNANVNEDYLQLPMDITEVESRELGRYFNAFTQQKMYVRSLIGRVSNTLSILEERLSSYRSEIYSSLPAKTSVKEKEMIFQAKMAEEDNDYSTWRIRLQIASDYLEGLNDGITLISREISRRESDWEVSKREDNIGKKRI